MTMADPRHEDGTLKDMSWALRPAPNADDRQEGGVSAKPLVSKRQQLLQEATRIVTQNRNSAYGEPEDAFRLIADYWSLYLKAKYGVALVPADVPLMMSLLKLARLTTNPAHHDSQVDVAGYMACLAEMKEGKA